MKFSTFVKIKLLFAAVFGILVRITFNLKNKKLSFARIEIGL